MAYGELSADKYTVGLWHCNGDANDASGNANHGTVSGATLVNGRFGQAYSFDGNDTITCGAGSALANLGPLTIAFWLKLTSHAASKIIIDRGSSNGGWKLSQYGATSKSMQFLRDFTNPDLTAQWNNVLEPDAWHWYAMTWDGGLSPDGVKLYQDAVLCTISASTSGGSAKTESSANLIWGSATAGISGILDDMRIANVVRSADEIRQTYAMMKGAYGGGGV